jgi:hypothetical protein
MTTRTDKALAAFNAGFTSKAAKKRALDLVSRDFDHYVHRVISDTLLDSRPENCHTHEWRQSDEGLAWNELYWNVPSYPHEWKGKHSYIHNPLCPEAVETAERLVVLRETIKGAEVVAPIKDASKAKAEKITKSIKNELERLKKVYYDGLDLSKRFGGLDVYTNVHLVTNEHGTTFVRCFYYLFGKLTPLNIIIAVAEKHEADKKEKES